MPKQKTNKSLRKRVKLTGKGKVRIHKSGKSHLLSTKSRKRKRRLRKPGLADPAFERAVKRLLAGAKA